MLHWNKMFYSFIFAIFAISGKFFCLESELLVISCGPHGPSVLYANFDDL